VKNRTIELTETNKQLQEEIDERNWAEESLIRSEEEARRLTQENAIMAEIGRIISSTLNIEEVYERFAEEVRKLIPSDRISISINNPEDSTVTIAYVTGVEIGDRRQGDTIPLTSSINKEIIRTRSGLLIQAEEEGELINRLPLLLTSFQAGFRSMMSVPLFSKDEVIGVLHLRSIKPNAYTERDLRIAERVGNQIAGAIANAQLFIERKWAEEEYRTVVRAAMDGFWIVDMQGRFLDVNDAYCRLIGYSRDELLTMRISDVEAVEKPEETARRIQKIMEGGGDRFETHHKCKDGRIIDIEVSVNYMEVGGGRMFVFLRDITERKRAEEAIRRSEEEAKQLSQENGVVAEIGRIISSTLNIDEVYERFAEEVRKLIPFDRIVINVIDTEKSTVSNVYMAGKGISDRKVGEIYALKGSGSAEMVRTKSTLLIQTEDFNEYKDRFPMLLSTFQAGFRSIMNVPLFSKGQIVGGLLLRSYKPYAYTDNDVRLAERVGNQIAGAIANAQLFTERKRAEEALYEGEKRFRDLFDEAPVGYHELDTEGRIRRINRTELEMLGYTAEEMLDQPVWKFIVEKESQERVKAKLAGDTPSGKAFERTYRRKDGTTFPVLIEDRLLRDSEGRATGIRSTIQDITELKRIEKEMASLEEQLRQSQRIEAIGRLAGGIAHDFNNLLTVIKGYSELLLIKLKEGDPLKGNIEEIHRASQRATDLTRQLLAFSRRQILAFKVLDLNTILQDMDKMLHRLIGEDIELVYLLSDHLGKVRTDPGQIEQVILNLAVNARDAMPSGGKLTIETANLELDETYAHTHVEMKPGPYVMLSVSDTGCGMSPEVKEHLFEPFFTTKEKGKGTGLGLSTVYGIVKQSEGDVWVYSEPGQGTTFKIYLPRVEEEASALPHGDDKDSLPWGRETVLLVEDELSVRGLAVQVLRENGYNLLEAANGIEALRMAQEYAGEIHLLLTDVVMPQMGGKELADRLKPLRPDIKVLFTSGYTDNAIVHHGVLEPGIDFLQKPFSPVTLAQKVRKVLDK
jgi:PAS domain S-box-containing protein